MSDKRELTPVEKATRRLNAASRKRERAKERAAELVREAEAEFEAARAEYEAAMGLHMETADD